MSTDYPIDMAMFDEYGGRPRHRPEEDIVEVWLRVERHGGAPFKPYASRVPGTNATKRWRRRRAVL